jgi:hypothetical protein
MVDPAMGRRGLQPPPVKVIFAVTMKVPSTLGMADWTMTAETLTGVELLVPINVPV